MEMLQPVWLGFALLVVLAPLSEELLFRGFLYGGLAQSRIGPVGAILVTSGIWTVIHVQYTWLIMTQVFIYGVVFGVVRWRSGSLWPPMITHGLVNLLAGIYFYGG
jgi:membrane protease YdiL (CAAX protease family)